MGKENCGYPRVRDVAVCSFFLSFYKVIAVRAMADEKKFPSSGYRQKFSFIFQKSSKSWKITFTLCVCVCVDAHLPNFSILFGEKKNVEIKHAIQFNKWVTVSATCYVSLL